MKNPKAIMFVGRTHSGKTTVARALAKKLNNEYLVLDMDDIDLFLKDKYPEIVEYEKHSGKFYNKEEWTPMSKMRIQNAIYRYAIETGKGVILSNGHSTEKIRSFQKKTAEDLGVELIGVNFRIGKQELLRRIKKTDKYKNVLTVSKNWEEVLEKQLRLASFCDESEVDKLIEIDAIKGVTEIVKEITDVI